MPADCACSLSSSAITRRISIRGFRRRAPAGSQKRRFYVWSDTGREYADTRIIFTDTESSNWTWDPVAKAFYWHRFFSHQPDLNFDNPHVLKAVLRVMHYWFNMGVDG